MVVANVKTVPDYNASMSNSGVDDIPGARGEQRAPSAHRQTFVIPAGLLYATFFDIHFAWSNASEGAGTGSHDLLPTHVRDQLAVMDAAGKQLGLPVMQVYYRFVGHRPIALEKRPSLCADFSNLRCQQLDDGELGRAPHVERMGTATLGPLQQFCRQNPSSRVSYIHSSPAIAGDASSSSSSSVQLVRLDSTIDERQRRLLRHLTMAATSEECYQHLRPPPSQSSSSQSSSPSQCNLCGLAFRTGPVLRMQGNMWMAQCEYVNSLEEPGAFSSKMEHYAEEALVREYLTQLSFNVSEDELPLALGLGEFAHDHWAGSGPLLRPCDLSTSIAGNDSFWVDGGDRSQNYFAWALAPRLAHPLAREDSAASRGARGSALPTPAATPRVKELDLLAGHLLKWFTVYGRAPPRGSWVWSWFPDAELWQQAVASNGTQAVDAVTEPFTIEK
jgi:hypothetical protein